MTELMRRRRALMAQGEAEPTPIENFERVGTPTIVDGWMTPSSSSWIRTPESFAPGDSAWELQFEVRRGSTSNWQNMISSDPYNVMIQSGNDFHKLYLRNGSSWNISNGAISRTISYGQTRLVRIKFTGSSYIFGISSDEGTTWDDTSLSSSSKIGGGKLAFGPKGSNTSAFDGSFNLNNIKIWIDGVLWWTPYV